jgi:hypothetical protein
MSPFIEQVRKIRVGEFEAEIAPKEVDRVKSQAYRLLGTEEDQEQISAEIRTTAQDILDLLDTDQALALAKLRMELESRLNRLYLSSTGKSKQRRQLGFNRLVGALVQSGTLPSQLSGVLREVILLCNRAVHGEFVRPEDARSIAQLGIQLLDQLDSMIEEAVLKPAEKEVISPTELEAYMDGTYRITTIVPLVKNPYRSVRILDQEGLDNLLQGYDEYAEFLVGIEKIDAGNRKPVGKDKVG